MEIKRNVFFFHTMHNQSIEFIAKNVNVFKLKLHHFRGKCSWGLLKPGGPEEISNSESPYVFDCQSQEGAGVEKITVYLPHFLQSYLRSVTGSILLDFLSDALWLFL